MGRDRLRTGTEQLLDDTISLRRTNPARVLFLAIWRALAARIDG